MKNRRSGQLNHQGFTLIELVVVLVLMGILLSISAAGLIAFQDQAGKLQKNESAQTIFMAAQSKLTQMEGNGQIEELKDRLKDEDGNYSISDYVPVFSPINDEFNRYFSNYITKTVMHSTSLSEEGKSRLAGSQAMLMTDLDIWGTYDDNVLLSLRAKAGDYDLYVQDPSSLPVQTQILFELIEETVADKEILNGAICIEIAPEEGQIFSAFYSDTAYEFFYGNKENGSEGRVDIAQRFDQARTNKGLGYYGVNSLTHVTYLPTAGISLGELTVDNGNTLSYHLAVADSTNIDLNDLTYMITVYDSTSSRKALEFTVDGKDVKNKSADIMENMVECPTVRYDVTETATNLGNYKIPIYKEQLSGETVPGIGFILDAADEAATTELLEQEAYDIRYGHAPNGIFAQSLSFFRFGTWTEIEGAWTDNIFVTITVTSDDLDEPAIARSKSTSPMFADATLDNKIGQGSTGDNNYKRYGIENCRHFYNMRYYEDVEITTLGLPDAHASDLNKFRITFVLREDLDWAEFAQTSYYASSKKYFSDRITSDHRADDLDFPAFKMLRSTDTLTGLKEEEALAVAQALEAKYPTYGISDLDTLTAALENNWTVLDPTDINKKKTIRIPDMLNDNLELSHRITNLSVTMQSNYVYGLYRNYASGRDLPTGLFLENLGTIKYFAVDQISVVGKNKVGAICGSNRGTLLYVGTLSTRTDAHKEPSKVQGIKYVGGVFGYQASIGTLDYTYANRDVFINYLTNHAWVTGTMYVGGITSYVVNGDQTKINDTGNDTEDYAKIRKVIIRYCENYGLVRGVHQPLREGETIDPADEAAVLSYRQSVRYIGGIVGYMNNIKDWPSNIAYNDNRITACYSCPVYHTEYDKELLEQLEKLNTIRHYQIAEDDQQELLELLNEYNVGYCVGGIAGYAGQIIIDSCGVRLKDNKIVDGYGNELTTGYIFGDQYVGGVIGFNDSYIVGSSNNVQTVCGNDYVGGIIGINVHAGAQTTEEERLELLEIDIEGTNGNYARANSIVNRGYVFGLYDYVGGIAGYNAGNLENSRTEALSDRIPVISGRNYVGGITGRSQGSGTCGGQTVLAAVNGENYVGGLVGYIGPSDPYPKSTTFEGGSVYANGSFAGGIAGIVMNPNIYDISYSPRPVSVVGRYFVGGAFGGSIINPTRDVSVNDWVGRENYTELDLRGTACVGGSIGYNVIGNADGDTIEEGVRRLAGTVSMKDEIVTPSSGRSQKEVVDLIWSLDAERAFGISDYAMLYRPSHNAHCIMVNSIAPIEADGYENKLVYAAGVVGYNGNDSILNMDSMSNYNKFRTNSIRTTAIDVMMDMYNPDTHQIEQTVVACAFTGNFVGCNTYRSTITNCQGQAMFSTEGTYRGGLCEINNGTINNPRIQNNDKYYIYQTNDEGASYIGGVCGRNNGRVIVSNCGDANLQGKSVIGMVAAENYGTIELSNATFNGVRIYGESNGSVVGAVVGRNIGSIQVTASAGYVQLRGYSVISGGDCVGGFIGEQVGPIEMIDYRSIIQSSQNSCIQAPNGVCGGLIGRLIVTGGDVTIRNCIFGDSKDITGNKTGGLIGAIELLDDHKVVIQDSYATRFITGEGADSMSAGIVGYVHAVSDEIQGYVVIRNCYVAGEVRNNTDANRSAGIVYDAGGRTVIDTCRVYAPKAGYGITATQALAIMNCFDGSLKGIERFGSVTDPSVNTIRNNYCMCNSKNYTPNVNGEYPEDYTVTFTERPVQLNTYKNDSIYDVYATYLKTDPDTGAEEMIVCDSGIHVNAGNNPGQVGSFYNDYSGQSTWKNMENAYMQYIETHSVPCEY